VREGLEFGKVEEESVEMDMEMDMDEGGRKMKKKKKKRKRLGEKDEDSGERRVLSCNTAQRFKSVICSNESSLSPARARHGKCFTLRCGNLVT